MTDDNYTNQNCQTKVEFHFEAKKKQYKYGNFFLLKHIQQDLALCNFDPR